MIIKSSTSEVSFLVDTNIISIKEQDFILIIDSKENIQQQYLAQVEKLIQTKEGAIEGTAIILGEIDIDNYSLAPCRFPISPKAQILHPPEGLVSKVISYRGKKGIYLGDVITSSDKTDPFLISPGFLERHVLCVASTGAGKSYSVGVLLEEILLKFKSAAVLLFDVHNEYWGLMQPNDSKEVDLLDHGEYSPQGFQNHILLFEKDTLGLGSHFDLPRLRRLVELSSAQENSLINLIKHPTSLDDFIPLIRDSSVHSATRENLISKIHSLKRLNLFDKALDLDALIKPGQISIIRLDQFIDERKRDIFVNEILSQVFEKKIQGDIAPENEIVVIIEEAHRFATTSDILPRIAREGRKFGIYEILISQRPGDLPDNIIANMNTLIALRIRSDKDLTKIRLIEGISTEMISVLPHLTRGEALIVGLQKGIQRPIKIRVRPRLSKHVDPQKDKMPENIPRYRRHFKSDDSKKEDRIMKDESEFDMKSWSFEQDEATSVPLDIELFDYKDLTNLLACKHILILHKNTGICIFELGTSMLSIDSQLVSGFLSAITGLFSELKNGSLVKDRTIIRTFEEEIGDHAFKIITVEGTYSVTAFILDRTPKYINQFKQRIREFVYVFETEFQDQLSQFLGVLDHFTPAIHLLDRYIGLSLTSPLQLNRSYEGRISNLTLYEIINNQMDQLARHEGLFAQEILSQCLLDSDYSYREIIQVLLIFLREGILVLKNPARALPSFVSKLEEPSPEEITSPGTRTIDSTEPEEELGEKHILSEKAEYESAFNLQNIEDQDISWFSNLLTKMQSSSVPDSLKSDILERDLIFESGLRIKANSVRVETFTESDLNRWALIMTQKGFVIDQSSLNPLNGIKLILKTEFAKIASSISLLNSGDYLIILGEVL